LSTLRYMLTPAAQDAQASSSPLLPDLVSSFVPGAGAWLNRFQALSQATHARLGVALGTELLGEPLPTPRWVATSEALARDLGWPADWHDGWHDGAALQVLSGNATWPGMSPMATVYSGHQFGQWAGQLGDGRALLLGEVDTPMGPQEVQLKGAGMTPYSRRADGRAVLRSSIREFLCSEAMHALGIPTTRALALTASPQAVRRETLETAAVVTRVAPSFIRFGHFEHFAHSGKPRHHEALAALLDFVVTHHFPQLRGQPQPALALLDEVVQRTAELMAAWQSVGFCHGVMNTDNMSILGLTIDYGPFGFLDAFDPDHICNHSDDRGRYSWNNQPQIGYWNLRALAHALLPLVPEAKEDPQALNDILQTYEHRFPQAMNARWRAKLGLHAERPEDQELAIDFLRLLTTGRVDFTIAFRRLGRFVSEGKPEALATDGRNAPVRDLFLDRAAFDAWATRYALRLQSESSLDAERAARMGRTNPLYVLRNHMAETAIRRAQHGDDSEVQRLQRLLQNPFDAQTGCEADADFPPSWAQSIEVSCSS
jgi:uncharacterized protein YdiU (UPF0061 family)